MATDATGIPTSPDAIPTYNTSADAPSGLGFNAAMAAIQAALVARVTKPAGIASGEFPVWNGTAFVRSSATSLVGTFPGAELAYQEFTSNVPVSATTEATANTVVTAAAVTLDGSTRVTVEFSAPAIQPASVAGGAVLLVLYDGTSIGYFGQVFNPAASVLTTPVLLRRTFTPAATAHTYSVRAFQAGGNGQVSAGLGGASAFMPGYIRITRA